jgi:hypothetical protein
MRNPDKYFRDMNGSGANGYTNVKGHLFKLDFFHINKVKVIILFTFGVPKNIIY